MRQHLLVFFLSSFPLVSFSLVPFSGPLAALLKPSAGPLGGPAGGPGEGSLVEVLGRFWELFVRSCN